MSEEHEQPYTNRELREKWLNIEESLVRIYDQTKHTNGRVTSLERWKYIGIGATAVLTTVVIPILSWAIFTLVNIHKEINIAIENALSVYNIEYDHTNKQKDD